MMETLFNSLFRFTPKTDQFFSGTLCGPLNNRDSASISQGSIHLLSRGFVRLVRDGYTPIEIFAPSVILFSQPFEYSFEGPLPDGADLMCATLKDFGMPLSLLLSEIEIIDLTTSPSLQKTLEIIFEEVDLQSFGYTAAINRLLQYTLILVIRYLIDNQLLTGSLVKAMSDPKLQLVISVIHEKPSQLLTIKSMAAIANMSRSTFVQRFTQIMGIPPSKYVTNWRMQIAREMLSQGNSVKTVAKAIGFPNTSSFARSFHRLMGSSPTEWLLNFPLNG